MSVSSQRKIVLVTRRTRLEELVTRFNSKQQARFYIERMGENFIEYENEHNTYSDAKALIIKALHAYPRRQQIDRQFLSNYLFMPDDVVLVLGQDGLVANVMKYLNGQVLVGINPDHRRYDGLLLTFKAREFPRFLPLVMKDRLNMASITMAQARLSDGQVLYAVNDFFIGPRSHTSARYELQHMDQTETQSSSGVIVSTGLGSTAWMKSIFTGAQALSSSVSSNAPHLKYESMPWDARSLMFAVREPFPSRHSQATIIHGTVSEGQPLTLRSLMPEEGVIFSDGMEHDYLRFTSGVRAEISVADKCGALVML